MKKLTLLLSLFIVFRLQAQMPSPALIGYWHNWNDTKAPYIRLDSVDKRYNVIEVAFAAPTSNTDMTMLFVPDGISQSEFKSQLKAVQAQGRKVLISIGGANASIDLSASANKTAFINSMTSIIDTFGFDGIDIDIENGNTISISGGTISAPTNTSQLNLIDAIKQIMANYRLTHSSKLLLTLAPETAYMQGGQSAFSGIWGGYLPIIDALKDSLDMVQVQLYNSGTMYGIDGKVYTQGTADFVVAMVEAAIKGFSTTGGTFSGLPASKVAVAMPACTSAAGGGYLDSSNLIKAIQYLRGNGTKPGTYTLSNANGYKDLNAMMTWSINWDAVASCASKYEYAEVFGYIYGSKGTNTGILTSEQSSNMFSVYPNPSNGLMTLELSGNPSEIIVKDILGQDIYTTQTNLKTINLELSVNGIYIIYVKSKDGVAAQKVIVSK